MSPPLLLHVGYHKTATTWMQDCLFQPECGFRQLANHTEVFRKIVRPHGLAFDASHMRALISERRTTLLPGEVPVVSSEILSGNLFYGGRESDSYAARLAEIAPEARILISIRSQLRILPSAYMQYVLRGGTMPPERFFEGTNIPGYFGFAAEHFEYDRLVALYQRLFGAENVYVQTQESLQKDMDAAAGGLARFAGAERFVGLDAAARKVLYPSYPEHAAGVLRRINHIQRSTLNPSPIIALAETPRGLFKLAGYALRKPSIASLLGHRKPISDLVRARFTGHFVASNARLAGLLTPGTDLSAYEGASTAHSAIKRRNAGV